MKAPAIRERMKAVFIPALLVFIFVFIVAFLRDFRPEADGFEQKGPLLLLYHASRLGLALYITILCYSVGYWVLRLFRVNPQEIFNSARKTFILCFFFGASLYGVVFTVLGLSGLINLKAGLSFTIPVLFFCYRPLKALISESLGVETRQPLCDSHANVFFMWFVILMAVGTALVFLLTRTVFIPVFDPNIWEHYLHYYRAVLASGSTQPNEVWHHFYATKGAGLIFMANVLSDFFGAQIVSACFVVVAAVIILDLLLEHSKSISWAFFGVMLFFTFLYGQVADGATFKHHAVILGYMSFTLWGSIRLQQATQRQFRLLMVVLVVSLAYFGFYQPAVIVLLPPTFLLLVMVNMALHSKTHLRSFLFLACGLFAGTSLVFGTNWALTGLAEVTPMRWTWAIADHAKVEKVFGTGGVEFFLAMNNDLAKTYDWSFKRTWNILRYPLPMAVVYLSLLGMLIALILKRTREAATSAGKFLMFLAAFIFPFSAFAQAVQTAAVDRMALYSIVFMTLASVVALKGLTDACVGTTVWHAPSILKRFVDFKFRVWRAVSAMIIICGMGLAMVHAWKSIGQDQRPIIFRYVTGAASLKDSMRTVEGLNKPSVGVHVDDMLEFRKTIRVDERILRLAYDAGFSYALPGEGIVSEPTYSLIRNPQEILAAPSSEVIDYLRARNINYFTINLQGKLFSTIAFTAPFNVIEMPKYFRVVYEKENFFILTWRLNDQDQEEVLPGYLMTVFELKRTGVLHFPFTEQFAKLVPKYSNQLVGSVGGFEKFRTKFQEDIDKKFGAEVLPRVSLETSKALLRRILEAGKEGVGSAAPDINPTFWQTKRSRLRRILGASENINDEALAEKISERELGARFLSHFRNAIYKQYEVELGSELAPLFRYCDERVPFARNYPAGLTCY